MVTVRSSIFSITSMSIASHMSVSPHALGARWRTAATRRSSFESTLMQEVERHSYGRVVDICLQLISGVIGVHDKERFLI